MELLLFIYGDELGAGSSFKSFGSHEIVIRFVINGRESGVKWDVAKGLKLDVSG